MDVHKTPIPPGDVVVGHNIDFPDSSGAPCGYACHIRASVSGSEQNSVGMTESGCRLGLIHEQDVYERRGAGLAVAAVDGQVVVGVKVLRALSDGDNLGGFGGRWLVLVHLAWHMHASTGKKP